MPVLPATDLGLMSEHLSAHEGIINKLNNYYQKATHPQLKDVIALQASIMHDHVKVMLALVNPYDNLFVEVPPLSKYTRQCYPNGLDSMNGGNDKWIAQEAHTTAKLMANDNYVSALMMKNSNSRQAHVEMALQQFEIQKMYDDIIQKVGWSFIPHAAIDDQVHTYQHFQHLIRE